MKKKLFTFLVAFGLMIAGTASATLYNYYNEQGLNLPSVAERVEDATMCNITNYSGTEAQNIALEECMTGHYDTMLGATPTPTSSANRMYVEAPDITLYGGAIIGDTTITLDNAVDIYNNDLSMDYFGDKGYFRINPNGDNISEAGTFTGMTANSDGTFTLTGVKTALAKYPYTETSGLVRSHAIGSIVRFTNTAGFYNDLANKENDEIIDGTWDFSTYLPTVITTAPTTDDQVASKKYVDDTALSGAPDATLTVKGISELATQAEMVAGTATGGTSANLVVWNSYVSSTSATGTIPVSSLTNAYLDSSWGGSANSLATLDSNTLVVENPANATSTPTADKIPIADGSGKIDDDWISDNLKSQIKFTTTADETISANDLVTLLSAPTTKTGLVGQASGEGTSATNTNGDRRSTVFTIPENVSEINQYSVTVRETSGGTMGINCNVSLQKIDTGTGYPDGSKIHNFNTSFENDASDDGLTSAGSLGLAVTVGDDYAIVVEKTGDDGSWQLRGNSVQSDPLVKTAVKFTAGGTGWETESIYGASSLSNVTYGAIGLFVQSDNETLLESEVIGVATASSTDGNSLELVTSGVMSGFTGLVKGTSYYVSANGAVADSGTKLVGRAISTTELYINIDN